MISACSSTTSMLLGIVRCDVLSAAANAMAVIPGTDATTWKRGASVVGRPRLLFFDRMTLRAELPSQHQAAARLADVLRLAVRDRHRRGNRCRKQYCLSCHTGTSHKDSFLKAGFIPRRVRPAIDLEITAATLRAVSVEFDVFHKGWCHEPIPDEAEVALEYPDKLYMGRSSGWHASTPISMKREFAQPPSHR